MGVYEDAPEGYLRLRFAEAIEDLKALLQWRGQVELQQQAQDNRVSRAEDSIAQLADSHKELVTHLNQVNSTLNKLLLTIAGSALTIAISVMVATRIWG